MRKIVYTKPEGGIAIVHPVRNTKGETLTTDVEIEQRAWDRLPPEAIDPQWVEESQIPKDRTFRNAWDRCPVNGCRIDMAKAREIHKDKLRALRAPKLAALDVEYMRADEVGDSVKKEQIAAKKRSLRDVTKDAAIEASQTPEELKSALPEVLRGLA